MGKIAKPLGSSFTGGRRGIADAGRAMRREAVREFVGGKQGVREGVDGDPPEEVGARRESLLACVVEISFAH